MEVLREENTILNYRVNPECLNSLNIRCNTNARHFFRTAELNAYTFTHIINFLAKEDLSDEVFIEYQSKHVLTLRIQDVQQDAYELVKFVVGVHESMKSFIESNSLSYDSLFFMDFPMTELKLTRMQEQIILLSEMVRFEDKDEQIKKFEKFIDNAEFKVNIQKVKIDPTTN